MILGGHKIFLEFDFHGFKFMVLDSLDDNITT